MRVDSLDVFCERGVFSVGQTRRLLQAARRHGWMANFHAEELHRLHSVEVGDAADAAQAAQRRGG